MNIVSLNTNQGNGFFSDGTMKTLLPEIRLISELHNLDSQFTDTGCEYVFKVHLTFGVSFEMGFDGEQEAVEVRQDIIMAMMGFWGPDNIICSNGIAYDVTICQAVLDMSDVFQKKDYCFFSLQIEGVPNPVNLVFPDVSIANRAHSEINDKIEFRRIQTANNCLSKEAVNL